MSVTVRPEARSPTTKAILHVQLPTETGDKLARSKADIIRQSECMEWLRHDKNGTRTGLVICVNEGRADLPRINAHSGIGSCTIFGQSPGS